MNFKSFLLNEKTYNYVIPDDKEQLMYDFYVISYLDQFDLRGNAGPKSSGIGEIIKTATARRKADENTIASFEEARTVLLSYLKEHMLEAVMFAIAAEFRHVFDKNNSGELLSWSDKHNRQKFFKKYALRYQTINNNLSVYLRKRTKLNYDKFKNDDKSYRDSYISIRETGIARSAFVDLAEKAYRELTWNRAYGGKAWGDICAGWTKLNQANTKDELIVAIDHVYDLQHNTNTVFNKLKQYYKSSNGYKWIKDALDHKRYISDPHDLLNKCSKRMVPLANAILKSEGFSSWTEFLDGPTAVKATSKAYHTHTKWIVQYPNLKAQSVLKFTKPEFLQYVGRNIREGARQFPYLLEAGWHMITLTDKLPYNNVINILSNKFKVKLTKNNIKYLYDDLELYNNAFDSAEKLIGTDSKDSDFRTKKLYFINDAGLKKIEKTLTKDEQMVLRILPRIKETPVEQDNHGGTFIAVSDNINREYFLKQAELQAQCLKAVYQSDNKDAAIHAMSKRIETELNDVVITVKTLADILNTKNLIFIGRGLYDAFRPLAHILNLENILMGIVHGDSFQISQNKNGGAPHRPYFIEKETWEKLFGPYPFSKITTPPDANGEYKAPDGLEKYSKQYFVNIAKKYEAELQNSPSPSKKQAFSPYVSVGPGILVSGGLGELLNISSYNLYVYPGTVAVFDATDVNQTYYILKKNWEKLFGSYQTNVVDSLLLDKLLDNSKPKISQSGTFVQKAEKFPKEHFIKQATIQVIKSKTDSEFNKALEDENIYVGKGISSFDGPSLKELLGVDKQNLIKYSHDVTVPNNSGIFPDTNYFIPKKQWEEIFGPYDEQVSPSNPHVNIITDSIKSKFISLAKDQLSHSEPRVKTAVETDDLIYIGPGSSPDTLDEQLLISSDEIFSSGASGYSAGFSGSLKQADYYIKKNVWEKVFGSYDKQVKGIDEGIKPYTPNHQWAPAVSDFINFAKIQTKTPSDDTTFGKALKQNLIYIGWGNSELLTTILNISSDKIYFWGGSATQFTSNTTGKNPGTQYFVEKDTWEKLFGSYKDQIETQVEALKDNTNETPNSSKLTDKLIENAKKFYKHSHSKTMFSSSDLVCIGYANKEETFEKTFPGIPKKVGIYGQYGNKLDVKNNGLFNMPFFIMDKEWEEITGTNIIQIINALDDSPVYPDLRTEYVEYAMLQLNSDKLYKFYKDLGLIYMGPGSSPPVNNPLVFPYDLLYTSSDNGDGNILKGVGGTKSSTACFVRSDTWKVLFGDLPDMTESEKDAKKEPTSVGQITHHNIDAQAELMHGNDSAPDTFTKEYFIEQIKKQSKGNYGYTIYKHFNVVRIGDGSAQPQPNTDEPPLLNFFGHSLSTLRFNIDGEVKCISGKSGLNPQEVYYIDKDAWEKVIGESPDKYFDSEIPDSNKPSQNSIPKNSYVDKKIYDLFKKKSIEYSTQKPYMDMFNNLNLVYIGNGVESMFGRIGLLNILKLDPEDLYYSNDITKADPNEVVYNVKYSNELGHGTVDGTEPDFEFYIKSEKWSEMFMRKDEAKSAESQQYRKDLAQLAKLCRTRVANVLEAYNFNNKLSSYIKQAVIPIGLNVDSINRFNKKYNTKINYNLVSNIQLAAGPGHKPFYENIYFISFNEWKKFFGEIPNPIKDIYDEDEELI